MIILGIETSCDETAAAVVKDGRRILSSVVASSAAIHAKYGGIIPEIAAREQIKSILPVISEALSQAFPTSPEPIRQINALAVTTGPGLIGSLLVGVSTAKTLSYLFDLPIIPVNHLIGHIYANWPTLPDPTLPQPNPPAFPLLALVVSGGHTDLVLMRSHRHIQLLGTTRDDAAGEAFDKTARLLHLPYPGGPELSRLATTGTPTYTLPHPLSQDPSFDWSFSGLKTAVTNLIQKQKNHINPANLAASIETTIAEVLVDKTLHAVNQFQVNSLLLAGGVSANSTLRSQFQNATSHLPNSHRPKLFIPPPSLCTDNAATTATTAYYNFHPLLWQDITTQPSLTITD